MQKIYKDKSIVIFKLLGSGIILIAVSLGFILTGDIVLIILGLLLLSPVYYLAHTWLKKPTLLIQENKILVRNIFGKVNEVPNTNDYKLVLSNDYFAFRIDGKNDIMVDKGWFKKDQLEKLIQTLRSLDFKAVIE